MKTKHCIFLLCLMAILFSFKNSFAQVRVANSGYLGVGTSNPQALLHVNWNGGDYSQAIKVEVHRNLGVGICVSNTDYNGNKNQGFYVVGEGWFYTQGIIPVRIVL